MKRFLFRHIKSIETGFVVGVRLRSRSYAIWLGYGKPIWWKPRFLGRGKGIYGFGFGWLLLCFRVQVFELDI